MLRTKRKKTIGQKRPFNREIIETIKIFGIQNSEYNFLNSIYISITSDHIKPKLTNFRKYRCRFVLESILFSSSIENETDVIFVTCDGLSNVNTTLINKNLRDTLGVCYLHEIKEWDIINGQSKRSQAKFTDSEELTHSSHIVFAFTTKNFSDLLNFSITLLDSSGNNITFPKQKKKSDSKFYNSNYKLKKMFDEKKQVLEIINGFKNLSSKIRDENVKIKETLTKNETTISACKKEYQKLYQQHEKIQQENEELKQYIINLQQQLQQD